MKARLYSPKALTEEALEKLPGIPIEPGYRRLKASYVLDETKHVVTLDICDCYVYREIPF